MPLVATTVISFEKPSSRWRLQKWRLHRELPRFYELLSPVLLLLSLTVPQLDKQKKKKYDLETKHQSSQWNERGEPKSKKARFAKSKVKTLLITFLNYNGLVHHEFIPFAHTIKKEVYLGIMKHLREAVPLNT
ncbi:CLCN3 [Cordylochernes scorpioides]|uniref:CLCN3 n=1 Tax=Cordylochernes scorpioides TaxID=51811 RepID=A0ABY6JYS2_9ARAC|nr:CLCN3 [Cordylochernes scorpioides]